MLNAPKPPSLFSLRSLQLSEVPQKSDASYGVMTNQQGNRQRGSEFPPSRINVGFAYGSSDYSSNSFANGCLQKQNPLYSTS